MRKYISPKLMAAALVVGMVAVPSIAMAHYGPEDSLVNDAHIQDSAIRSGLAITHKPLDSSSTTSEPAPTTTTPDGVVVETQTQLPDPSITVESAITIAKQSLAERKVVKVEVENEDGIVVIEVKFSDGTKVIIRASDGVVIKTVNPGDKSHSHKSKHDNKDDKKNKSSNRNSHAWISDNRASLQGQESRHEKTEQ